MDKHKLFLASFIQKLPMDTLTHNALLHKNNTLFHTLYYYDQAALGFWPISSREWRNAVLHKHKALLCSFPVCVL